jgi:hypothetical protein
MTSSKPKTAEANFREAFERLKAGAPKALPPGTPLSQNNVAKEAGCDPSALRKSRFPGLVAEIQSYLTNHGSERAPSERQRLLKQRQRSRDAHETINDLRSQRDAVASLLVEANAQIGILTLKVRDLEARVEDLQSKARVLPLPSSKSRATPRPMDRGDDN